MSLYRGYFILATVDPMGWGTHRLVAKSFINGVSGGIGTHPFWINPVSTAALFAFARTTGLIFQELPNSDAKDLKYRLFTMIEIDVGCCEDEDRVSSMKLVSTDTDSGFEPGGYRGTIDMTHSFAIGDDGCGHIGWMGWGHPDPRVEWSFQAILMRTSINIWHKPRVTICCKDGKSFVSSHSLRGSNFPSHHLWTDNQLRRWNREGPFISLWRWDVNLGRKFVTEDPKGPFTPSTDVGWPLAW
jgi:hypothetical protein